MYFRCVLCAHVSVFCGQTYLTSHTCESQRTALGVDRWTGKGLLSVLVVYARLPGP